MSTGRGIQEHEGGACCVGAPYNPKRAFRCAWTIVINAAPRSQYDPRFDINLPFMRPTPASFSAFRDTKAPYSELCFSARPRPEYFDLGAVGFLR